VNNDATAPVISAVAAGSITATGATVTWTTNEASDSQVEYGLTASYGTSTALNASLVTAHSAPLSGLTASTTYHYRVKSHDADGAGHVRVPVLPEQYVQSARGERTGDRQRCDFAHGVDHGASGKRDRHPHRQRDGDRERQRWGGRRAVQARWREPGRREHR